MMSNTEARNMLQSLINNDQDIVGRVIVSANILQYIIDLLPEDKDNCEVCLGEKGGVLGNENVIDDVVMCDYCSAERHTFVRARNNKIELTTEIPAIPKEQR